MAYGTIKVDTVTFTSEGIDTSVSISGLVRNPTFSGNITSTSTISGVTIQGGTLVSGATVTGSAGQFTTITGGIINFTTITGTTAVITSGVFASGTAAAPSVSVGTTTNGIYSPGANQVAITTSGTGRLLIDGSGNLIQYSTTTLERQHRQQASSAYTATNIKSVLDGAAGYLTFDTGTNWTNGNAVERLRITSDGKVGIGTSSPGASLDVVAGNTSNYAIIANNSYSSGDQNFIQLRTGSTVIGDFNRPNGTNDVEFNVGFGAVVFGTGTAGTASERLRITADGKVGIGTSSPNYRLDVTTTGTSISSSFTSDQSEQYIALKDSGTTLGHVRLGSTSGAMLFNAGNTERLRITADGKVGIGTTSPIGKVDITGTSIPLILQSTVAAANYITHRHVTSGDIGYIGNGGGGALTGGTTSDYVIRANLGSLIFACNGDNERARIDSSGRLLVGTSSARTKWFNLTLTGPLIQTESNSNQMGVSSTYTANDASGPIIALGKTRGSLYEVVSSGDDAGVITFQGGDGAEMVEAARITAQIDGTPGANDMPGRLVFSTTADGASGPTTRLNISNQGIVAAICDGNDVLSLATTVSAGTTNYLIHGRHSATAGSIYSGTTSILVWSNGNVQNTNNSYGAISDAKLKENIVDAGSQWDDLKALQVRKYNFKEGQTHTQIGLVAQEVELVSPGLVSESPDRDEDGNDLGTVTKSVNYSVLYMKAVKALQEAMERIETLEAKVAALETP